MRKGLRNKRLTVSKMHTQFMMKRRTTLIPSQNSSNMTVIWNPTLPLTTALCLDHIIHVSNQETKRLTSLFGMDSKIRRSFIAWGRYTVLFIFPQVTQYIFFLMENLIIPDYKVLTRMKLENFHVFCADSDVKNSDINWRIIYVFFLFSSLVDKLKRI